MKSHLCIDDGTIVGTQMFTTCLDAFGRSSFGAPSRLGGVRPKWQSGDPRVRGRSRCRVQRQASSGALKTMKSKRFHIEKP